MSTTIQIILSPRANALLAAAPAWPVTLPRAIADALDKENELTTGYIQRNKLSRRAARFGAPDSVGVVTNRLRLSARPTKAAISGDTILSSIGTNVLYGGVHEFGYTGVVQVKAFTRRNTSKDVYRFSLRVPGGKRGDRVTIERQGNLRKRGGKLVHEATQRVRAHKRRVNFPARHMFRTGIEERVALGSYSRAVSRAVIATLTLPPTTGGAA